MPKQAPSFVCKSRKPFPALCSGKCKPHCVVWSLSLSLTPLSSAFKLWWRTASSCNYQMLCFIWLNCFPSADSPLSFFSGVCCQVRTSCAKKTTFLQVFSFSLIFKADEKSVRMDKKYWHQCELETCLYARPNYQKKKTSQLKERRDFIFGIFYCGLIFRETSYYLNDPSMHLKTCTFKYFW